MKLSNAAKTLMFPVVLLSCIGGAFVAWCGIVVLAIPGVIYAAVQVMKLLYGEAK